MEKIGMSLILPNEYSNHLYRIFEGIDLAKYYWEVLSDWSLVPLEGGGLNTKFFETETVPFVVTGDRLYEVFCNKMYYPIGFDIRAYYDRNDILEMSTFQEYFNSNCLLALFCCDAQWYDIYCKDEQILEKIYGNCLRIEGTQVEFVTVKTNERTRLGI